MDAKPVHFRVDTGGSSPYFEDTAIDRGGIEREMELLVRLLVAERHEAGGRQMSMAGAGEGEILLDRLESSRLRLNPTTD